MNYSLFKKNSLIIIFWLIALLPVALIFSKFATNTIVGLISIFIIIFAFFTNKFEDFKNKYIYFFLFFWFYITVRSIFSDYPTFSLKSSLLYIRFIFLVYAFYYLNLYYEGFLKKLFYIFFISSIILVFDAYIQFIFGTNLIGYDKSMLENNRISGFFGKELVLGSYVMRFCFIIIALSSLINIKYKKFLIILMLFITLHICLVSGERTSFFLAIIGTISYFVMTYQISFKNKLLIFFSVIILTLVTLKNFEGLQKRMVNQTIHDLSTANNILMFSKGHSSHFMTALNLYQDNKMFGQGSNLFRILCDDNEFYINDKGCSTHPHNFYYQILAENGLIGLSFLSIFYSSILFMVLKHCYYKYFLRKRFLDEYKISITISLLVTFWPLAPSGNFFNSWLATIYFIQIALLFVGLKKNEI